MKTELTIISDDLNHGIIDEKKARTLLLDLLGVNKMDKDKLKGVVASELIIVAMETKGKRPTQLNFEEMIDVVADVVNRVKKLSISDVRGSKSSSKSGLKGDDITPYSEWVKKLRDL